MSIGIQKDWMDHIMQGLVGDEMGYNNDGNNNTDKNKDNDNDIGNKMQ